jgi:hypothetical protein
VPSGWRDVAFYHLRAEGAFLVSAVRRDGITRFVTIVSLAGEPCRVKVDLPGEVRVQASREIKPRMLADGVIELDLRRGESATLFGRDDALLPREIAPVMDTPAEENYFGGKALADRVKIPYWGEARQHIKNRPGDPETAQPRDSRFKWEPGSPPSK